MADLSVWSIRERLPILAARGWFAMMEDSSATSRAISGARPHASKTAKRMV